MDETLSRLADAAGIEARYWDIGGRLHETSAETARRLLSALGFPAATDMDVAASLARLEEEAWRETLPAAVIAAEGDEIAIPLRLPAGATRNLRWSLDLEGGGQADGSCNLEDLEIEAAGAFDGRSVVLRRLRLPAQPLGYHRLRLEVRCSACNRPHRGAGPRPSAGAGPPVLGHRGPALRLAIRKQLGHGRFHRSARVDGLGASAGRRRGRGQSAPCALSG